MKFLHTDRTEMISMAVALVAIIGGTTYYYYVTKKPKGCLDPKNFKEFKLVRRLRYHRNVVVLRFSLPTLTSVLGLPVGQHISCRGRDFFGEEVVRQYTPITLDSDVGYFDLLVKMYPRGRMSHHFRQMHVGDYLAVKGPQGRFKYQPNEFRAFGMIAGGTGITPMFQVTKAILENPEDKTIIHLIYANGSFNDILLKPVLDYFALMFPSQFSVYYVLNQQPPDWQPWEGGVGLVSRELIRARCPAPAPDIKMLRCGPSSMNRAIARHLQVLGYSSQMQFQF
ncbi:hypothetical protein QN277_016963 [Acacia crassicarpa]|uniref:cytochrome-b5 reductase n=1 Tax=Acacia crassicarpa TaxID=499986 RepID=A0AAE1TCS6_9FABA|nr:hypothetical protein QN277_016963 [Acacia crassicarpa]